MPEKNDNYDFLIDIYGDRLTSDKLKKRVSRNPIQIFSDILTNFFHVNRLKSIFDWCREDLTTVVLLISGVGAVIQVYHLAKINLAYVKFFSITQLIADGSLIFVTVLTVTVVYKIQEPMFRYLTANEKLKNSKKATTRENVKVIILIAGLSVILSIGLMNVINKLKIEWLWISPIWSTIMVSIQFVFIFFMFKQIRKYYDFLKDNISDFKFKKTSIWISNFALAISMLVSLVYTAKVAYVYLEAYSIPFNTLNYRDIKQRVKDDHSELTSYKFLYFNDLYTFVEIGLKGSEHKTRVIYKTDDIMFMKQVDKADEN